MSRNRSYACVAFVMLLTTGPANAADFQCPITAPSLPHESWGEIQSASADELYRRVRQGLAHWSGDLELHQVISESLTELLQREPDRSRGYVELAHFLMIHGAIDNFTLSENTYDIAGQALQRAIELDPESVLAWALEGLFRDHRRGRVDHFGNGKSAREALEMAELYGSDEADVAFAWARWHEFHRDFELAAERIKVLLEADNLGDSIKASAYRRLAEYYAGMDQAGPALRAAERAIEIERNNPNNWLTLSTLALEQQVDAERALTFARTAFCIEPSSSADRRIAYALYVAWAEDNVGKAEPTMADDRVIEAFERHPNVANVMGYMSDHKRLASLVEVFIVAGLSPDVEDSHDGLTMLYDAIRDGRLADAERLIELGADVNLQDERYGSFLSQAVLRRDEQMVRLLLEHGANVNAYPLPQGTALIASIMSGDTEIVELLLEAGADPELANEHGETALAFAAFAWDDPEKRLGIVRLLLEAGANPDIEFRPGLPLIDQAIRMRYDDVAELLREAYRARQTP